MVAIEKTKDKSWRDSLMFFQKSPDYYVPDLSLPGTTGRVCYNGTRPQPRVTGHVRLCARVQHDPSQGGLQVQLQFCLVL